MIRPMAPQDTEAFIALAGSLDLFSAEELDELRQMFASSSTQADDVHPFWIADDDDGLVGVAYCEPERMTDGTWNLQLLGVHPTCQRQGRGTELLRFLEQALATRGARILLVETAGTPDFKYVRTFYRQNGFEEEACIREFYAPGVDKVVYRKALGLGHA